MSKTRSVSAIRNGTVIDHIPNGQALRIIQLLNLAHSSYCITIGMHLLSKRMGNKDLIKIESKVLSDEEASQVVVFAPEATINIIEEFSVTKKVITHLPAAIKKFVICPNESCITHTDKVNSYFYIDAFGEQIMLNCKYCEKQFNRDQLLIS